jgi:hypothetical protein
MSSTEGDEVVKVIRPGLTIMSAQMVNHQVARRSTFKAPTIARNDGLANSIPSSPGHILARSISTVTMLPMGTRCPFRCELTGKVPRTSTRTETPDRARGNVRQVARPSPATSKSFSTGGARVGGMETFRAVDGPVEASIELLAAIAAEPGVEGTSTLATIRA